MTADKSDHLREFGTHVARIVSGFDGAWNHAREHMDDPVVLDQFGIQCATVAAAVSQLAERAQGQADALLDDREGD